MRRTNQQDVVKAKEKIAELKSDYMHALTAYLSHDKSSPDNGLQALLGCHQAGNAYFNYMEEFVGNSDLLGAHQSALWAQGFAEDCAETLRTMPQHFELLTVGFKNLNDSAIEQVKPGATAYANMQRMAVKYLDVKQCEELQKQFEKAGLPVYGFSNDAKEFMSKKLQIILSFIFGVVFISVMLVIGIYQPTPSSFQYGVFRTVLALAGAGVVAVIPGFIEVKFGNWLRAGGAVAVFVLLYSKTPVMPKDDGPSTPPISPASQRK